MSIYSGPEIISGNLMLYYDIKNTDRSWKGKPTTNIISNADTMTGWINYYRTVASSTFTTEFGTTGYRFIRQPSWNGIQRNFVLPATGTYTFSARIKYLGGSASNNGASVYVSGWGGNDVANYIDKTKIGVWQDINITVNCTNTNINVYLISFGGTDNGTGNPDYSSWEVTMPQIEAGSSATPFVNGTRSDTQAILDMTGRNTITANSLTYFTNNVFSFDGTNNFITAGPDTNIISGNQISVEAWVRTNVNGVYKKIFTNGSAVGVYLSLGPAPNNIYFGVVTSGTSAFTGSATSLSTTSYSHLVGTYNGSAVSLYLNGTLLSSTAASGTISTGATTYISGYPSGGERWDGAIDAIKVYNRALSASEVTQNFVAMRGRYGI